MPSGAVGPASLKHIIHDLPYARSRRGKWNMVNSYGRGEGSGTYDPAPRAWETVD